MISSEDKAINAFVNIFSGSYVKLVQPDTKYKVLDKDKNIIAYADVAKRNRTISTAYPLIVKASTLVKLVDKRLNPVIIWACDDGIIYGKIKDLVCEMKWGSELPQATKPEYGELICFFEKQKQFKYIKYT
jgi:hypothetical protein